MRSTINFRPLLLPLEDRTTPAGNVFAQVVDGTLVVDGDAGANSIIIAGTGWHSVTIRAGDSDTLVNDVPFGQRVFLGGITRGIVVRTNEGEDTVVLEGVRNRHYIGVFAGSGEDEVVFTAVENRGTTEIDTGDADDTVSLRGSTFRKSLAVRLGTGDDTLEIVRSKARKAVRVDGGDGNDLQAADSSLGRTIAYRNIETTVNGPLPPPTVPPEEQGPPSVVVSSSAGESTAAATVPFTVTFSEAVSGFDIEDLGVTNGLPSGFSTSDNVTFNFVVTPREDGAITVDVPAGVATDRQGDTNTAATPLTVRSIRTDAGMTDTVPAVNDPSWVPTGSGLATWDIQTGSGTAVTANTSQVQVFYTGWLTDGTVFDSARTDGQPASFDPNGLIAGFREGLIGMQPGGIRRFRIPPELGYGASGTGTIPPNATLIFEVKLVSVS